MTQFDPKIFKAYDIRAIYPDQLDDKIAYAIGQAYAKLVNPKTVVVGHDVRLSGPVIYPALIEGLTDAGVDVVKIGGIPTEQLYFAVGNYGYDGGIVVTASHNPAEYNGFKMVRKGAEPITGESGIYDLRDLVPDLMENPTKSERKGTISERDIFEDFKKFILGFIDVSALKPMKVVANGNFGYQAQVAQRLFEGLPIELVLLNGEPDGSFPKGRPDPFVPENRPEFLELIKSEHADFGVAWDADADRVFFATHDGVFIEGYFMSALLAQALLKKYPGEKILYDVRYTWAIIDAVNEAGGTPIMSKVGHTYIKKGLREENAVFCGEASGHIYFRDFYYSDTGILPLLYVLEMLSQSGKTLSEHVHDLMNKYFVSGEINTVASNADEIITAIKEKYSDATTIDESDRLTIEYNRDWRANIRTSNTEPLFRLNVEAKSQELMEQKRDELVEFIKSKAKQ